MAYLTRKRINGNTYYYAEESERKNGKRRRKWQKYLGTVSSIIAAVEGAPKQRPKYAEIFQLGSPAAYMRVVEEFNMIEIINSVFPKREQ